MGEGRVLVTGATGFVGGRLVERLVLERGANVRALLRDLTRAARIARFDVELARGDAGDAGDLSAAVQGCRVVFHCAHDGHDQASNVAVAHAVARACVDAGVERLVYVSSAAVHEPLPDGPVTEDLPLVPDGSWPYRDSKIRAEDVFLRAALEKGLPVVIIRPTIVYGPFGSFWTAGPIHWLRRGRVALPRDGGLCNAVYVDDVVEALLLAAESHRAVGERILVSGPHALPWVEYFGQFERALGVRSVVLVPLERLRRIAALPTAPRIASRVALTLQREPLRAVWAAPVDALQSLPLPLPAPVARRLERVSSPWRTWFPDEHQLALLSARATVSIDKARALLGYEPRFDIERGMRLTSAYIEWAGLGRV